MKRFLSVCLMVVIMFSISGCMTMRLHLTVNRDNSYDLNYQMGMEKSLLALQQDDLFQAIKENSAKEGFEVSNFSEGNFVGIQAGKHFKKLDDLNKSKLLKESFSGMGSQASPPTIKVTSGIFQNEYQVNGTIDLQDMINDDENPELTAALLSQLDLKFILTLPVKPLKNNAGKVSVDGRTMEWTLIPGQVNSIGVRAKTLNLVNIIGVIIAGILILTGLGVLIFRKIRHSSEISSQS